MSTPLLVVFGLSGQVGTELARAALRVGYRLSSIERREVDLAAPPAPALAAALDRHAGQASSVIVVNLAGYTAVDQAETDADACNAINCVGPASIARACHERGFALIHLSSDYVFNGRKKSPYNEADPVGPLNVYGRAKLAGEIAIREITGSHVILRTSWLYSPFRTNFVKTMLRLASERSELQIVHDQRGCPTAAADLAEALVDIARQLPAGKIDGYGTFHYCGRGACTWFEFANEIFALAGRYGLPVPHLDPVSSREYVTPALRPANSVLDCSKILDVYKIDTRPWQQSLAKCLTELLMREKDKA
jgi:dTDP-4-dehydrorhamnose reductase